MQDKARLQSEILVVMAVIGSLFLLGTLGFQGLSGLRAYVRGEGLYAKSQQEATYQLLHYVHSGDESRYQSYMENLAVPLGDRMARLELQSPHPRREVIEQGFRQGGNHPDDVEAMITLYRIFKNVHPVDKAVVQWTVADSLVSQLLVLGEEIHQKTQDGPLDPEAQAAIMARIDFLQVQLTQAVKSFSQHMSAAARWATHLLIGAMLGLSLLAGVICFMVLRKTENLLKRLGESEGRFRRLAENAPDVIYRMALPSGQYEYMSPAAEAVLGRPAEDFYARPMLVKEIMHPDWHEYFAKEWENLLRGEISPTYEYKILNPEGEERWINQRNVLIKDKNNQVLAIEGVATDITDRKTWEEEKDSLSKELRAAHKMEAIGTLAGGIAHDFNNVLSSILGNAELAKLEVGKNSTAAHHLDEVLGASFRARDLIRRILSVSSGEQQGKMAVNIQDSVEEALSLLKASLPSNIKTEAHFAPNCGSALADPTQIHQVVMNLCTNAAYEMELHGGILNVDLDEVDAAQVEEWTAAPGEGTRLVRLRIGDTGPGISPEAKERIFDPYFTTKPMGKGSGMGLAVVKGIVVNNGGAIYTKNKPGGGAEFTVVFPRVEPADRPEQTKTETIIPRNSRILFVDDEPSLARMNQIQLERKGFQVTALTSSLEALELFRKEPHSFDLVITDQTMPQMTGVQLVQALLEIRADIPTILCTGFSGTINEEQALNMGIRAFVMKPLNNHELVAVIGEVLGS